MDWNEKTQGLQGMILFVETFANDKRPVFSPAEVECFKTSSSFFRFI